MKKTKLLLLIVFIQFSILNAQTERNNNVAGTKALGGLGGAAGGASLGATIGTFILPGIGTAIGGLIGAGLGAVVGSELGEAMGNSTQRCTRSNYNRQRTVTSRKRCI